MKVPNLKGISFETAIIERYRRRESSVEEALIEMHLTGVSVRRVEDITKALWCSKVSPSTISKQSRKRMFTSKIVEAVHCRVDGFCMSICRWGSIYAVTGAER